MKAVVYKGPHSVAVEQVTDPKIESPSDALVKITSTAIYGLGVWPEAGSSWPSEA